MPRMAVIGGGAAGAAIVAEYLRSPPRAELSLAWITGPRAPGRGVAYSTAADHHLLNVRAAGMGLFVDRPGDFLDHLLAQGCRVRGSEFVARERFGDFVEATLARLMREAARAGVRVDVLPTEAVSIAPAETGGYAIGLRDGAPQHADEIVLALGALPPAPLDGVAPSALVSGAYALDPWALPQVASAPREVVVVGTGLTAVDAILDIAGRWPDAHVAAISRHGRFPLVHAEEPVAPYPHQSAFNDALFEHSRLRGLVAAFRETLAEQGGALDWRALLDGLRPATAPLWRALDARERRRFLRHLRPLWEIARHRMPPQTARALAALAAAGRLDAVAGRIVGIDGAGPLDVRHVPRGRLRETQLRADLVVQATGFQTRVDASSHRLIRDLLARGLAGADPLGLGLLADPDGRLLRPDGRTLDGVRAIGTLLRGALWECSGLPEIRALAREIVQSWRGRHAAQQRPRPRLWATGSPTRDAATP